MATLTTTITESVTINGATRGNTISQDFTIHDVFERVVTVPTSEVTLYSTHASVPEGNVFDDDFVKYARITNLDANNFITLSITNAGSDEALFKVLAGDSFILTLHDDSTSFKEGGAADDASLHAISTIKAQANSAACQVEVFVGSSNA
mgnify:CR=1 FL=1|tara:strand:+ start:47 stop:493 length:447 start_codon:yes stop_codon:yes gene_type:complete